VTTLAAGNEDAAVAARKVPRSATWWPRLRPLLLAVAFPAAMLAMHFATVNRPGSLIPQPCNAATHSRRCQSRFELGPLEETKSALHAPL